MKAAVEAYVALRRVAGFALGNTEYLLRSFARFTHDRHEAHIRTASVVEWAGQAPSLAQRHRRYETVRLFAEYAGWTSLAMTARRLATLPIGRRAVRHASIRSQRSSSWSPPPCVSLQRTASAHRRTRRSSACSPRPASGLPKHSR